MQLLRQILLAFSFLLLFSCQKADLSNPSLSLELNSNIDEVSVQEEATMVPNEILVKFKPRTNQESKRNAVGRLNANIIEHIHTPAMKQFGDDEGIFLLKVNENALDAIAKAKNLGEIEYAEPNWLYESCNFVSNDPLYLNGSTWGMYGPTPLPTTISFANQFGSRASTAWSNGNVGSSAVYVGLIDVGYMFNHQDLAANAGVNPLEFTGISGKDDDGNGLIDDIRGWNFLNNNNVIFSSGSADNHGTSMAGIIGAVGGNGLGVAGVAWNVKLLSAKFQSGTTAGTSANAAKAIDYFTTLKTGPQKLNIVATNNPWAGFGYSQAVYDAIQRANQANILFVAAAGNGAKSLDKGTTIYPAGYNNTNIISVAGILNTGAFFSKSNFGTIAVDLGAPSTASSTITNTSGLSAYGTNSGTSVSAAHVTGAVALYASKNPLATASEIKTAILNSAYKTPTPSLVGKCLTGGRLNVTAVPGFY